MKRSTRILIVISLALMLAGTGTCYFGQRHAENQIPEAVRAQMSDTDWVGSEWIERGMYLFLISACVGALPILINLTQRLYSRLTRTRA